MSKPHSDPFDQGGQVTHQHVESHQHSEPTLMVGQHTWDRYMELLDENKRLLEQLEARTDLLRRIRQWDMLNTYVGGVDGLPCEPTADAPYWRSEIDRALSNPANSPNGEQTREQLLERLALTVREAIAAGSFDGTLFESQVSGTLWLLYGEQSPASSPHTRTVSETETGSAGYCGRHGLFTGRMCPDCAEAAATLAEAAEEMEHEARAQAREP